MLISYSSLPWLTAKFSAATLEEVFGEWLVTCGLWLPRFVALNPCGGICWGHWKIRIHVNNVHCMQEMKIYIWREVLLFQGEICEVSRNIFSSCGLYLVACQHFEAILWHKVSWPADEIMDCKLCSKAAVTTAILTPDFKYALYNKLHYFCVIQSIHVQH